MLKKYFVVSAISLFAFPVIADEVSFKSILNKADDPNISSYIVNGDVTDESMLPWQVRLKVNVTLDGESRAFRCGGSIIDQSWVLTAAHCLVGGFDSLDDVQVITKEEDVFTTRSAIDVIIPSQYVDEVANPYDIALLKMPYQYDTNKVIKLGNAQEFSMMEVDIDNNYIPGSNMSPIFVASGYGVTENDRMYDELRYVKLAGVPFSECGTEGGRNGYFICATAPDLDLPGSTCNGDSGGPLIYKNALNSSNSDYGIRLMGVTSYGALGCTSAIPSGYTSVFKAYDFLNDAMRIYEHDQYDIRNVNYNQSFNHDPFVDDPLILDPEPVDPKPVEPPKNDPLPDQESEPKNKKSGGSFGFFTLLALGIVSLLRLRK